MATKKAASGDGGLREKLIKRSSSPPRVARAAATQHGYCRYGHGFVYARGVARCQRNQAGSVSPLSALARPAASQCPDHRCFGGPGTSVNSGIARPAPGLALRVLEAAAGFHAAVLLALHHAAVAGEEAALLEHGP